jgi:hypothetical protein
VQTVGYYIHKYNITFIDQLLCIITVCTKPHINFWYFLQVEWSTTYNSRLNTSIQRYHLLRGVLNTELQQTEYLKIASVDVETRRSRN